MIRATGLASATGLSAGGVESGGFWEGKTRTALQALLHAAALDGRPPASCSGWTSRPSAAADAVAILSSSPAAATGLGGLARVDDPLRPQHPRLHLDGRLPRPLCLADPRVLDAVSPGPGEDFDPATSSQQRHPLPARHRRRRRRLRALVAAFIEDLVETARHIAARSPGARLDPPLLLALDEIGNLAPLPSLPMLMAEGGGTGITTMPVLQSLAQAREKWCDNAAGPSGTPPSSRSFSAVPPHPRPPRPVHAHR